MKKITSLILLLTTFLTFSQNVTVTIENLKVDGVTIPNNGPINLGTNSSVNVTFRVDLSKDEEYSIGPSTVYIDIFDSSGNLTPKDNAGVPINQFIVGASANFGININENDIDFGNGNYLVATLKQNGQPGAEWDSTHIPINKSPTFELEPNSISISCGDTTPKTFQVINSSNLNGVTYLWNIGNGWSGNVNNNSSISLTPIDGTTLPSDVSVIPVYNGVNQPILNCNVYRASFSSSNEIIGDDYVCDSGIYTLGNLPSGITISSVSVSHPNIATATLASNGEITVNRISDGIITLSAVLQNSCNQTSIKTKDIQIGIPASVFNASISGDNSICQGQNYTYNLQGANHPCVSGIVWNVTPNLNSVSQSNNSITVSKNASNNSYAAEISASITGTSAVIRKGVWVGVPNNSTLRIHKIGSYDLFANRWSKLQALYNPISYESNAPLNITFDWQIPNSMIKSYNNSAFKDVKPRNSGLLNIGVRIVSECGNGQWFFQPFNVNGNPNTSPITLTPWN